MLNLQTGSDLTSRGLFWPSLKEKYLEEGLKAFSFPLSDKTEEDYMEGLFDVVQHLNDLVNEQGHTVYIQDTSALSRGPTLLMAYICLFAKYHLHHNLKEVRH